MQTLHVVFMQHTLILESPLIAFVASCNLFNIFKEMPKIPHKAVL